MLVSWYKLLSLIVFKIRERKGSLDGIDDAFLTRVRDKRKFVTPESIRGSLVLSVFLFCGS